MSQGFKLKGISLTSRFAAGFIIVSLLPLSLFGYLSLQRYEDELRSGTLSRMSLLADQKLLNIKEYLAERVQNVQFVAHGRLVEVNMPHLLRMYIRYGVDSDEYRRVQKLLDEKFGVYIGDDMRFYDVFLITLTGEIIYTFKHESDFATNLINGPYRDTQLAQAFHESSSTLRSVISDFEHYAPSNAPAAFISTPILRDGVLVGVMAFQLDTQHVYQVTVDHIGLGTTGETLLAKSTSATEALFVAPLRQDPQAAMRRKIDLKSGTDPMRMALSGQRGSGIKIDYTGKQVVAAWRYLPELRWGVIVKMDADEAFAPIDLKLKNLLEALLALILFAGAVAFYFSRKLIVPLKSFAFTADEIAKGDLSKRIDETRTDEIGALAYSFNRMTTSLQTLYRTLEDRVVERTCELNVSNKQLRDEIIERERAEDEIHNLAFYDALTKLPNRRLLLDCFQAALAGSVQSQTYGAILFLDLDRFKTINDTLGHAHGDLLLITVARRIKACVREVDTLARLGGDEFVVLVEEISVDEQEASRKAALVAEKIRAALSMPYLINNRVYHSSSSIGVCLYFGHDKPAEEVLKHADMAMYQAKDSGRNAVHFFDPMMQQALLARNEMEANLRDSLPKQQLQLYYQIQVDDENTPIGAEALIRWIHPQHGMISPSQFIPVAEDSSLILEIGQWVLEEASRQLAEWAHDEQMRRLVVTVNISAQQFRLRDFVKSLEELISRHGIASEYLTLELTESVVLEDVSDVVAKMHALKALGMQLSLDDFGTGYSSLSYLKLLPLDQIKIDQSFVRNITSDSNDAVIVKTIINMAQNFRLNVIAEGVETEAQLAFLKKNKCVAYQGYLFGKPVPAADFEILVRQLYNKG